MRPLELPQVHLHPGSSQQQQDCARKCVLPHAMAAVEVVLQTTVVGKSGHPHAGRALFRPTHLLSAHSVPSLVRQHHRKSSQHRVRSWRRHTIRAADIAQQVQTELPIHSATELIGQLTRASETIRCHQLSSASSLAVYRLTVLCNSVHHRAALTALAQVQL